MRVLITGLIGFTGFYVSEKFKEAGYETFNLDVNLCDAEAVNQEIKRIKPDFVAHLAAISFVAHANVSEIYQVNLIGTYNLLSAIEKYAPNIKSIL
jgi:nucleoside-diphosphate-sugar epimerase